MIPDAFRIAMSGRPGPVLVDVPKDVQNQLISFTDFPPPAVADALPAVDPLAIEEAARLINEAEQPVLYLGGGVVHSGASALAVTLAEQACMPTTMTLMGLGAMPVDHPLSIGMLGMHGARYTNFVLEEADVLVCVGARFDDRAVGKAAQFCPRAKIVHIDVDPSELHKIKRAHVAIHADVGSALEALLPRIRKSMRKRWLSHVDSLRSRFPMELPGQDDPRTHYGLVRAVAAALDDEAIITTDVGQHQMWVAQAYPFRRPRQWMTSGGLGTMGFGVPTAMGAALAEPDRTVVCFSGDGRLMMNVQELRHPGRGEPEREDRADEQQLARARLSAAEPVLRQAGVRLEVSDRSRLHQDRRGLRHRRGRPRSGRQPARRARPGAPDARALPDPCVDRPRAIRLSHGAAGCRQHRNDRRLMMIEQVADPLPQTGFAKVVLELEVNNHPGVMSHICNLFARRAFNMEGILCMPVAGGDRSRIWLLVFEDQRLEQMIRQLEKLEDVLGVRRHGAEHEVFERLEDFFH